MCALHSWSLDQAHGVALDVFALDEPVEEAVKAPVLCVNVALGDGTGVIGPPRPEPLGTLLQVGEIFLDVTSGYSADRRPLALLREESGHGNRALQAVQVGCGVPAGGLQADEEPSASITKTEIENLLDDHSLGGA